MRQHKDARRGAAQGSPGGTRESERPRLVLKRPNMVFRVAEAWRPPLFKVPRGAVRKVEAVLRRILDLQAGSIWYDLRELLPLARGTVLDVGCGSQPYRVLFAPEVTYIGIDTIEAKQHFGYDIPGVIYFNGERWPIDDSSIDFVLCTETMEHLPDPELLLAEALRCLDSGGTVLLTVPFAARWHFIPYDYWRFTPSGLARLLTRAGFVNTRVYARGNAGTVACYKAMALVVHLPFSRCRSWAVRKLLQGLFLLFVPLLLLLALVARISLSGKGGDDCLGYTVLAEKPPA